MRAVAFNPVDSTLASAALDRTICLWNVKDRKEYGRFATPIDNVNDSHTWDKSDAPLFSPDGKTVLALIYKGESKSGRWTRLN